MPDTRRRRPTIHHSNNPTTTSRGEWGSNKISIQNTGNNKKKARGTRCRTKNNLWWRPHTQVLWDRPRKSTHGIHIGHGSYETQIYGKNPPRQIVTSQGRYGAANSRTSLVMLDGVLYVGEYGKSNHKPVLPQTMVQQEKLRLHKETGCGGSKITCEHVRRRFHHSRATSTKSLEAMTDILIPCFKCVVRQKITLSRFYCRTLRQKIL